MTNEAEKENENKKQYDFTEKKIKLIALHWIKQNLYIEANPKKQRFQKKDKTAKNLELVCLQMSW